MKTLILKEHNKEIVKQLIAAGIPCCTCVDFFDAPWLEYNHGVTEYVHVGYPDNDEGTTSEQELKRFVSECKDPYYCKNVEEFINEIKKQQNGNCK